MKILITGVAGPRGRQIATLLANQGHDVVGVDLDEPAPAPERVRTFRLDHRKRGFEDLMRRERFEVVCHLAIHAGFRLPVPVRHRLNLEGSKKIIDHAAAFAVRKLVVASHAAVYGALPDSPYYMTEDAPPSVGRAFPEMQDVVAADLLAGAAMWKHPDIEIAVLRPVHCIGPTSRDTLAAILRREWVPAVLGYDPMVQIIHEGDLARAFVAAIEAKLRGVFNVVGPGQLPLSVLISEAGARRAPIPELLVRAALGRFGLPDAGAGVLEFLKHPCLVDGSRFARATGFAPEHGLAETARSVRLARGGGQGSMVTGVPIPTAS